MCHQLKIISFFHGFLLGAAILLSKACEQGHPDPRSVEGAIAYAAEAIEKDDARMLFRIIDAKSRHALFSIVADRRRSRSLIESSYPSQLKVNAMNQLGDAAQVSDAADLFARRCEQACRREIGSNLGAPQTIRQENDITVVITTRGEIRFRKNHSWYGIVWKTDELFAERDHANRDLRLIEMNAATYQRQNSLGQP